MNKYIFILSFLLIPSFSFAQSQHIFWSKHLGGNIVWQQNQSGDILRYKGKIIQENTWWFIDDSHLLCAYQGIRSSIDTGWLPFTPIERKQLEDIGSIVNGTYAPPDVENLSSEELTVLYRITSRYCYSDSHILPKIGERWIFITLYNGIYIYDTKLWIFNDIFLPERDIRKWKTWFFAIGILGGNERVEILPFDGKSYIDWMDTLFEDYSEWDNSASVIVNNYRLLRYKNIIVTFTLLRSTWSKTYTKEFKIITP